MTVEIRGLAAVANRFDYRDNETFKKDIKFSTMLEKYFFHEWLDKVKNRKLLDISSWGDNGCGNDGEFIAKGNTAGADYKISGSIKGQRMNAKLVDEPLEIKWVPTCGKFTLKQNDLKAYVKESASILFIYNSVKCGTNMRKPKDYDLEKHIKLIESKKDQIKWGVMWSPRVKELYKDSIRNNLFKPVYYMGGKQAIILKQSDFSKWFISHPWEQ